MRLRSFFFFLAFIVITLLAIIQFGEFQPFLAVIAKVNILLLLGVVGLRVLYYWTNTKYFDSYLKKFNHSVPFTSLYKDVVTMNFANTVFPTGGISGIAVLRDRLRIYKVDNHTTTVAQAFWMGFTAISIMILLLASLLLLMLSARIELVSFRVILMALLIMLVGSLVVIGLLIHPKSAERLMFFMTGPINWVLKKFKRNALGRPQLRALNIKFYQTLAEFRKDWRKFLGPFGWCFATLAIDIASLYMVIMAFGVFINPGVVIAAFLVALMASVLSVFSSGVGIFEIGLVAVLSGLGMGFDVSFSSAVVYRMIAFWMFLPVGLYFYKRTMLDGK